jgi:serine/threonine protein kinase
MKLPYSYAVDIWQLGILTYEMLLGVTPFTHENRAKVLSGIISSEPAFPSRLDWRVKDFISRLLTKDPAERPTFDDLKSHPFFEGFDWEKVIRRQYRPHFIPPVVDPLNLSNFDPTFTREVAADSLGLPGSEEFGKVPGFSYSEELMGQSE